MDSNYIDYDDIFFGEETDKMSFRERFGIGKSTDFISRIIDSVDTFEMNNMDLLD